MTVTSPEGTGSLQRRGPQLRRARRTANQCRPSDRL